jgi:hypothetical protein
MNSSLEDEAIYKSSIPIMLKFFKPYWEKIIMLF